MHETNKGFIYFICLVSAMGGLLFGYYGLSDKDHAMRYLAEAEALDHNHQGIQQFRTLIDMP